MPLVAASTSRTAATSPLTGTATTTSSASATAALSDVASATGLRRSANPAAHALDTGTLRRERDRGADEAGADDGEPLDRGRRRGGRCCGPALALRLLFHDVEQGLKNTARTARSDRGPGLSTRPSDELSLRFASISGAPVFPLVRLDAPDELEPAVERVQNCGRLPRSGRAGRSGRSRSGLPVYEQREQRLLHVQTVLRLLPHSRLLAVEHVVRDLLAGVRGQAVQYDCFRRARAESRRRRSRRSRRAACRASSSAPMLVHTSV